MTTLSLHAETPREALMDEPSIDTAPKVGYSYNNSPTDLSHASVECVPTKSTIKSNSYMKGEQPLPEDWVTPIEREPAKQSSVKDFLFNVFKNDLEAKVKALPVDLQDGAQELVIGFQHDLLSLINATAQTVPLSQSQMWYLRCVIGESYQFEIRQPRVLASRCDQARIITVATYLNTLDPRDVNAS